MAVDYCLVNHWSHHRLDSPIAATKHIKSCALKSGSAWRSLWLFPHRLVDHPHSAAVRAYRLCNHEQWLSAVGKPEGVCPHTRAEGRRAHLDPTAGNC